MHMCGYAKGQYGCPTKMSFNTTVDEIMNDLNGACIFSKLDLRSTYHQLELKKGRCDAVKGTMVMAKR